MRRLGVLGLPALGDGLLEGRLAGEHLQGAVVDLRLQDAHGAVEEDLGVGVVRGAGEELDVVRAVRLLGLHALQQGLALELADLEVVVGDVVVHVRGVQEQTVVGDDRGAGVLGLLELGAQLRTVDGADDDDLGALGDHGADLVLLLRDAAVGELHVRLEAGLGEAVVEQRLRQDPVFAGLLGERDADQGVLRERLAAGGGTAGGPGVGAAAGCQRQCRNSSDCCCLSCFTNHSHCLVHFL